MNRYNYKLSNQKSTATTTRNEVKSIMAKDASAAHWKIIDKYGANVKYEYLYKV